MAYRYEVNTTQGSGYAGNAVVFEGRNEAEAAARELADRWTAVRTWRVVETDDAVNYRFYRKLNKAVPLPELEQCPVCGDYDDRDHVEDVSSPCYGGG